MGQGERDEPAAGLDLSFVEEARPSPPPYQGGADEDAHLVDQARPEEDAIQPSSTVRPHRLYAVPDLQLLEGLPEVDTIVADDEVFQVPLGQIIQVGWRRRL